MAYASQQNLEEYPGKITYAKPVLNIFKIKVKQKEKIEMINALVENKMYKHDNKWCYIHELNL
jgi:hypothetical protein